MGIIYKIRNPANDKLYIGKSVNSLEVRRLEHRRKSYCVDSPLYKAMRKYGFDSFEFSIVEECENEKLNDKENQHIVSNQSYISYGKGYNLTMGGEGESLFLGRENEVVEKYNELENCVLVAEYFNCDRQVIARTLKNKGITPSYGTGVRKTVYCNELDMEFKSMRECAEYLVENNFLDGSVLNIQKYISRVCTGKQKTYKNYNFKIVDIS